MLEPNLAPGSTEDRPMRALCPVALAALLGAAALGTGGCGSPAPVRAEAAWARAADSAGTTAAYFMLVNEGADTLHVTGVSGDCAASFTMHTTVREGGMVAMREAERFDVAPYGRLLLAPGGSHVMLAGLRRRLLPGTGLNLTLHLSDGTQLTVVASVRP